MKNFCNFFFKEKFGLLFMKKKCSSGIGGQAVIEGVMMKGDSSYSVAVRKPDGKIVIQKKNFVSLSKKKKFFSLPFLRGFVQLSEMLVVGMKSLIWSANISEEKESDKLNKKEIGLTLFISILLTVGIFIVLPYYATKIFVSSQGFLFNLIDGFFRVFVFFAYLLFVSSLKDMKRIFQYHGAEHMSVGCYEAKKPLTPENCRNFAKEHPRCGTSFLVYVIVVSILVFSVIKTNVWYLNIGLRILLIPVIIGVSYEVLKFASKYKKFLFFRILILPGLWTQRITTKKPDDKHLEVAIAALKEVI
jgi:uncharacterized protein YqhQ